ncbi:hypothetical protein Cs7R123_79590 [Catellatospora sp. TT07R-123]|nr:hypothetical protein Cs7R123_79590 [Catellatospora sp. TT07R-123]
MTHMALSEAEINRRAFAFQRLYMAVLAFGGIYAHQLLGPARQPEPDAGAPSHAPEPPSKTITARSSRLAATRAYYGPRARGEWSAGLIMMFVCRLEVQVGPSRSDA